MFVVEFASRGYLSAPFGFAVESLSVKSHLKNANSLWRRAINCSIELSDNVAVIATRVAEKLRQRTTGGKFRTDALTRIE